jgi:hypothetical protein
MNCPNCGHEMKPVFHQPINVNGCAQPAMQYGVVANPTVAQPQPWVRLCSNFALAGGAAPQLSTFIMV